MLPINFPGLFDVFAGGKRRQIVWPLLGLHGLAAKA